MLVFAVAAITLFVSITALFVYALIIKDNSIVDVAYGLVSALTCWMAFIFIGGTHPRTLLLLCLVTLWGVRLAIHIGLRKKGETGEDFRYRQWRQEWGETFVWRSFLQIFMLQGAVVYVVILPVLLAIHNPGGELGLFDLAGLWVWLFGFTFEAVGDWQLLRFKENPANRGRIMRSGLWRYSRHPNYFGEAVLWWGPFLIALGTPYGGLALFSPLLIDFLLLKVSGIPMLEAKYEGNPEFISYREQTNALVPWLPRRKGG